MVTAENLKAEIIDKKITTAEELCTGRYAEGCKKLGIMQLSVQQCYRPAAR